MTAPPVVMTSSTKTTCCPAGSSPSASLRVPYSLACLRTNKTGSPVSWLSMAAIGHAAEFQAAEHLGVRRN